MTSLLFALLLAQAATPAPCSGAALPPTLAGWRAAATQPSIGAAFTVEARDPATIRGFVAPASRPGRAARVPIEIATAGTYRVALSEAAWVDVVRDGSVLPSVAHGHGPRCTGIRKIVDFKLVPGRYALQLSGMTTSSVRVLIARG